MLSDSRPPHAHRVEDATRETSCARLNPRVMELTRGLNPDATATKRAGERAPEAIAFGQRVRELRDARRWTQERLAEVAGLTSPFK